jgi:ribonuclease HI
MQYPDAPVTVNTGEYRALLEAIVTARRLEFKETLIRSDSMLIVKQVNGIWKCKLKHLQELRDKAKSEIEALSYNGVIIKIEWISREKNLAGKVLEKR